MNKDRDLPFTKSDIARIARVYPTPFYLLGEHGIRSQVRELYDAFSWAPGFKNYFATLEFPGSEFSFMKLLRASREFWMTSKPPKLLK